MTGKGFRWVTDSYIGSDGVEVRARSEEEITLQDRRDLLTNIYAYGGSSLLLLAENMSSIEELAYGHGHVASACFYRALRYCALTTDVYLVPTHVESWEEYTPEARNCRMRAVYYLDDTRAEALATRYIEEVEHQEGYGYWWDNFSRVVDYDSSQLGKEALDKDFDLYIRIETEEEEVALQAVRSFLMVSSGTTEEDIQHFIEDGETGVWKEFLDGHQALKERKLEAEFDAYMGRISNDELREILEKNEKL